MTVEGTAPTPPVDQPAARGHSGRVADATRAPAPVTHLPTSPAQWAIIAGRVRSSWLYSFLLGAAAAAAAAAGLFSILVFLVEFPRWLIIATPGLTPKDLLDAQNNVRAIFAQALIAIAAIATLYFTWRRVDLAEKTMLLTQETQITDRFAKAIEQLNGPGTEVRLGGIYSLERLAKDSAKAPGGPGRDYWTIMELFTAYVRHRAAWQPNEQGCSQDKRHEMLEDVQAALTVLGRREVLYEADPDPRLHLSGTDLRGADLRGAHLEGARLHRTHLEDADLRRAHLRDAILVRAHLDGASLVGADLERAHLEGAYLTGATGLTVQQVRVAHIDVNTKLPPEIRAALDADQPTTPPTRSIPETLPPPCSPTTSPAPPETTSPPLE